MGKRQLVVWTPVEGWLPMDSYHQRHHLFGVFNYLRKAVEWRFWGVQHTNRFVSLCTALLPAAKAVKTADLFMIFLVRFAGGWRKKADVNIFF